MNEKQDARESRESCECSDSHSWNSRYSRALLTRRILELSAKHRLCHLGSCFSCLPILLEIYEDHADDVVVLSNGHAGVALYCVLEARFGYDAEELFLRHGVHPGYDPEHRLWCSTGSLGLGLAVAAGYALAGRATQCVVSDGECAEGIVWETLAMLDREAARRDVPITVHVNANGYSATRAVDVELLAHRLHSFLRRPGMLRIHRTDAWPIPDGLSAHYLIPTPEDVQTILAAMRAA